MGKIDSSNWLGAWFHLPPFPADASFLNQKRTLFPERAWLAALGFGPPPRRRSWCSLLTLCGAAGAGWRMGQEEGCCSVVRRVEGACSSSPLPPRTRDFPGTVPSSEGEVRAARAGLNFAGVVLVSLPAIDPAASAPVPCGVFAQLTDCTRLRPAPLLSPPVNE